MGNSVSAQLGPYNTRDDWGITLLAAEIGFPEVKTAYVDLPLADGALDLSESVTGRPVYGQRALTLTLAREERTAADWMRLCTQIAAAVHGKKLPITLSFDSEYFYTGRIECETDKPIFDRSRYLLRARCEPYKQSHRMNRHTMPVGSSFIWISGEQVVCPSWRTESGVAAAQITVNGDTYTISTAEAVVIPDILLEPGRNTVTVTGQPVTICWRERRL